MRSNWYKKIYFKSSSISEVHIQNKPILLCRCETQECNGRYIKTQPYQKTCLHDYNKKLYMISQQEYKIVTPHTEFPYYDTFKKQFKIDDTVVFVYKDTIYTNYEMTKDLIEHEKTHLRQQNKIGADKWIEKYLKDPVFRLKQEIEAYKIQLINIKDRNERYRMKDILTTILSGEQYGNLVTKEEANKLLKE